jgi:hypothetical protein
MAEANIGALGAGFNYSPRSVEPKSTLSINGHRLKRYEVRAPGLGSYRNFTDADWDELLQAYLSNSADDRDHRVGFAILHHALDGTYLLVSRWYGGNMLKHEAFTIVSAGNQQQLQSLHETRIVACVWEFAIMAFERDAWVRTAMLGGGGPPCLNSYLDSTFKGWV